MKYTVHQINLSDDQYAAHRETYLNTTFHPTVKAILTAQDLYKPVAVIKADSLNDVFLMGNNGLNHPNIKKIDQMHSVSVGDVIVDETGHAVFVAPIGFKSVHAWNF